MSTNKTHKVVIISVKAERIGESDKIKCIIKTAALDIENNFLDMEMMGIFVDGEQVAEDTSNSNGELTITLQFDYKPEQEALAIHVQHLATGTSSPRKYIPIEFTWEKQDIPMPESNKVPLDKSIVIAIMQEDGMKLGDPGYVQYNDDYSIVLTAVMNNGMAFQYASDRLKNDKTVILPAIRNHPYLLNDLSDNFKDDFDVVLPAVQVDWSTLRFASDKLRDNKSIVICAISQNGDSLMHASSRWETDPEMRRFARSKNSSIYSR